MRAPDLTYTDRIAINLGGKRVEVISRPTAHADDNTIVRFVDGTNVLFASDWITVHRLPFGPIGDAETAVVKTVEAMDFEHFICSHGMLGKKADVTANIRYREELRAAVAAAIAAGQTLEQAQASVLMDAYKELGVLRAAAPAERGRHVSSLDEHPSLAAQNCEIWTCRQPARRAGGVRVSCRQRRMKPQRVFAPASHPRHSFVEGPC